MEVFLVRTDPQSRPTQVNGNKTSQLSVSWETCWKLHWCCVLQYRVVVPKLGNVTDLCSALSKLCGIPSENVRTVSHWRENIQPFSCSEAHFTFHVSFQMVVTDVYNHRFHKIYRRDENLNQIMEKDDIFVWVRSSNRTYTVPHCMSLTSCLICAAAMRCRRRTARGWTSPCTSGSDSPNTAGAPPPPCCLASLCSSPCPDTTS